MKIVEALRAAGSPTIEQVNCEPCDGAESPSLRCDLVARAV